MTETKMQLEDWLDDLCVRFIINLPREELESVERICFQVEEAQWFYEDFIRPLDPALPSLSLKAFALRIFQHCPLMANWSRYHHMTAFSEFLAYKTRVPVRGAIMLNQEMDEVVLVKGWKKGSNWSFPRGKINKDEKDLDCAIREVYEETGYDIREAGLVKAENDVKFIEITMREQHMRLYVFRGVPQDAYFEPRTRKEISKIEWYKLSDLPTLKKSKQYDQGLAAANANKFYMVAPFMHPLKKWIAQQKKLDPKTHLDVKQALFTEGEVSMDEGLQPAFTPDYVPVEAAVPSDLPEVAASQDASIHLKRLLNINNPAVTPEPTSSKSNALLELLRSGSSRGSLPQTPNVDQGPNQPYSAPGFFPGFPQQYVGPPGNMPQISPPHSGPPICGPVHQPVPQFPHGFLPVNQPGPPVGYQGMPGLLDQLSTQLEKNGPLPMGVPHPPPSMPAPAPYQQTGDPQFSHLAQPTQIQGAAVPPASKLPPPKLTSHSLALLSVFKDDKKTPKTATAVLVPQPEKTIVEGRKPSQHQDQLLNLLQGSSAMSSQRPAELSGHPVSPGRKQILQRPNLNANTSQKAGKGAWTSATVSGPLNMPQFEAIPKSSARRTASESKRQTSRDRPTQPLASPITILPRPQSAKRTQPPTAVSTQASQAPSRPRSAKAKSPEPAKPFQPQILRRSDNANVQSILPIRTKEPEATGPQGILPQVPDHKAAPIAPTAPSDFPRRPSQTAAQRETLLSLFSKQTTSPKVSPTEPLDLQTSASKASAAPSVVSPLSPLSHPTRNGTSSDDDNRASNKVASPVNKAFLLDFLQGVAKGSK
ncbi:hypothetical protein ARAM_001344 [Aspergillus rambellii]|uniref:Nudix hydrolase domain-containing protein n=2 Tax=Aspergillus subgen. Nidulantes TaxID=2720870 RepID=A0A0F8X2J7_9EURO|nr:hypothetical protein AOCH_006837 [Aspergillus ochraceoroseus]KKK17752.1 hypothetical protein ARAM_001344 [Aspergillus rambellii]